MIYDLAIIGNGIAAQSFLWTLGKQNFSLAHIYADETTPPCTHRSSATASQNGIEAGVSPLGDDMREAFFLFDKMAREHCPEGVEKVLRTVVATNENEIKKITRRYKTLTNVTSDKIHKAYPGIEYSSYLITPTIFSEWLQKNTLAEKVNFPHFAKDVVKTDADVYAIALQNKSIVKARKVLFTTGAYAKIFSKFFLDFAEEKNVIKAGSFLQREIDLGEKSFYLTIDGHQVLYRKNSFENKLIIGNVSTLGAFDVPNLAGLNELLNKMNEIVSLDLGGFSDFKIVTGLRHKGPKRQLILKMSDLDNKIFRINGLYKNGFTFGFLAAQRMRQLMSI